MVPGLSASSSSRSDQLTSRINSRQERHCSTSSSTSSSSPTVTSSGNETREREGRIESDISPVIVSTNVDDRSGQPVVNQANKIPKTHKKGATDRSWQPRCVLKSRSGCKNSEKFWWMTEFLDTETHTPVLSHEVSLEPTFKRREDLGKHSVYTHFPEDRNCEICQRTKITRFPCRRRNAGAVPRAENFGDLMTADHKVLSENCESRNNHRYAVVVQHLATQWIQAYPCKNKNFTGNPEKLAKVLGAR